MAKKITGIRVVKAGSSPDIDSDFHTQHRESAIEYVTNLYGKENVANIITFNTLAAKGALKSLCTIYNIPFKEANALAGLLPGPVEGKDMTLKDIFNVQHPRYRDAEDFRNAVSASKWKTIIEGALAVEGKNKSIGVHACGIIISSKPLSDVVPLHVRQVDERVITQWTYQECESIGLIKMDFLGLDTVDLIQTTIEHIIANDKTPPVLPELIHGDLADQSVYDMFSRGETIGIFQFGSDMVRDLLLRMKPTEFNDLVACTAVARPGPMGMKSHEKYADRKNGLEKIDYIHPEFEDSPLKEVLDPTYGLVLYQESVTQIANRLAGMTLQEGDDLRKAMGKKKADVMMKLKPKFISGGINNGYSEESMTLLWETLEPFSLYAFNKSHSVAYALNAYQAAYLKVHYPTEFMSALISQNIKNRDKTLTFLQEAKRMGLKVTPPNVQKSGVIISPDKTDDDGLTITFGLGAVKGIGDIPAQLIIDEREEHGLFTSLTDLVKRCAPLGVSKRVFVSLIESGACDEFHDNRNAMVELALQELDDSRKSKNQGESLFNMFDIDSTSRSFDDNIKETFSERVSKEANAVGLYLSSHPLDNIRITKGQTLKDAISTPNRKTFYIPATCVSQETKRGRGKTTYKLHIEDKTSSLIAYVPKEVYHRWDKFNAQKQVLTAIETSSDVKPEIVKTAFNPEIPAQRPVEQHEVAFYKIISGGYGARIVDIFPLHLSDDGSVASQIILPVHMKLSKRKEETDNFLEKLRKLEKKFPGKDSLIVSFVPDMRKPELWGTTVSTPPAIFDEELIRESEKAGIIQKEFAREAIKSIYSTSKLYNGGSTSKQEETIKEYHRLYKATDYEFRIDTNNEELPYTLEDIAGDNNYYLR